MIKRPYSRPLPLIAASVASLFALTSVSCTKDSPESSVEEVVESVAVAEAPESATVAEAVATVAAEDASAYQAMGYAMATQLRLNIGFSDDELDELFQGMRIAATNGGEPENFKESIQQAQTIYMGRMQAFQAAEAQQAVGLAAENKAEASAFFATLEGKEGIQKTASGLYYEVVTEGTGPAPTETDRVTVNYRGTLTDGSEFDANEGSEFMVNRVVPGFSEGLQLMKEGGKIKLYIPSELGYGDSPARPGSIIQPGDALIFDLELLKVANMPKPPSGPPPNLPSNLKPPSGPPPSPPTRTPPAPPSGPPNYTPPPPPSGPPPSGPPATQPAEPTP